MLSSWKVELDIFFPGKIAIEKNKVKIFPKF